MKGAVLPRRDRRGGAENRRKKRTTNGPDEVGKWGFLTQMGFALEEEESARKEASG